MKHPKFTDKETEQIFKGLFVGNITPTSLPENLFEMLADYLQKGIEEGLGKAITSIEFGAVDYELAAGLQENVFIFSGAKTFQQTLEMSEALVNEAGEHVPYKDFRVKALEIFERYNGKNVNGELKEGWLQAEYQTAHIQASNAKQWEKIERESKLLPYLRWVAVGDELTCPICGSLHNICRPVSDPFWIGAAHYNCRCVREQLDKEEGKLYQTEDTDLKRRWEKANVSEAFQFNPGARKEAFATTGKAKHPYFIVPKEYKEFARENFGLEISRRESK